MLYYCVIQNPLSGQQASPKQFYDTRSSFLSLEVTALSEDEVDDFRQQNNNIAVTNFDSTSTAVILKPVPKFEHAFHNYQDILATITCE